MADIPQPPENPFMNENGNGHGDDPYANGNGNGDGLDQGTPDVASRPGRVLMVLGIVGLILVFLLYQIFGGSKDDKALEKKDSKVANAPSPVEPPPLPETPSLPLAPPPQIIAPSIPEPTKLEIIQPEENSAGKEQQLERIRSKMVLTDSNSGLSGIMGGDNDAPGANEAGVAGDPNSAFAASVANSKAERVQATNIGDLKRTIAQGRIIQATMESALNTDLPAPIRAIVSRDTYGEAGREPLIPKGSRLIGSYNTDISGAQSRVFVVWTRVIRPDGVDVQLGSPLVDQIGQAGIGGQVDTKFQAIFSRSILASVVAISAAIASDEISGGSTTTTSSAVGGSSTTGDAATTATVDALNRLGGVSDNFIKRFIDMRPTILVDQGTPVNVFVNRDLVFPAAYVAGSGRIVN